MFPPIHDRAGCYLAVYFSRVFHLSLLLRTFIRPLCLSFSLRSSTWNARLRCTARTCADSLPSGVFIFFFYSSSVVVVCGGGVLHTQPDDDFWSALFFSVSIPNFTWAAAAAQAYVSKSSRALTSHGKWRNTWRGLVAEKKGPRVGSRHLFGLPCVCVSPSLSLSGGVLLLLPFLFQKVPILLRCNREKGPPRWITLRVRVAVRRWEVVGDTAAVCVASDRGARAGSNSFGCQSESNFAAD